MSVGFALHAIGAHFYQREIHASNDEHSWSLQRRCIRSKKPEHSELPAACLLPSMCPLSAVSHSVAGSSCSHNVGSLGCSATTESLSRDIARESRDSFYNQHMMETAHTNCLSGSSKRKWVSALRGGF